MIKLKDLLSKSILEASEHPEWWTNKSAAEQAEYIKKYPKTTLTITKENPSGKEERGEGDKDGWEIIDDPNVKVSKTRPYTDEEAMEETGEYFGNSDVIAPELASSEEELAQMIKDAPEETFSSEELQDINNSDAGEILDASEEGGIVGMKKKGKELATKYKKSWDYIVQQIEDDNPQQAPVVLRDKNGELHLMAGNTRIMSHTAHGQRIPIKVIDYDGEFDYEEWLRVQKEKEKK